MGIQRQMFICSHIVFCKETTNCCLHKKPHIKDEGCVPKICRFNPQNEEVDCVPVGKEHKKPEPEQIIIKAPAEIEPVKERTGSATTKIPEDTKPLCAGIETSSAPEEEFFAPTEDDDAKSE